MCVCVWVILGVFLRTKIVQIETCDVMQRYNDVSIIKHNEYIHKLYVYIVTESHINTIQIFIEFQLQIYYKLSYYILLSLYSYKYI